MQVNRVALSPVHRILVPFSAWALGIGCFFNHTIRSGFELIQGDLGDTRLINFILEHSYRWLLQIPPHTSFFDPPVFYPQLNVSAYTDLLLGVAPFYWPWRILGFAPDSAYQLWMIVLASFNFVATYTLLKRFYSCGVIASSTAAMIFAFSTAQFSHLSQQQLTPLFFVLISLMAILTVFRRIEDVDAKAGKVRRAAILVAGLSWAFQFYTSFYLFFFMSLVSISALGWGLLVPDWRRELLLLIRKHYLCLAIVLLTTVLLLSPALFHYLLALHDVGSRTLRPHHLAKCYSWFLTGESNFLYGWISRGPFGFVEGAHFLGIGYLTLTVALIGLVSQFRRASIQLIVAATLTTALLTTHVTNEYGLWPYVREIIPGAKALRALGRVAMIQMIPAAIGLGFFFQCLVRRKRWIVPLVLGGVCALEQVHLSDKFTVKQRFRTQIASIAETVDAQSEAFLLISNDPNNRVPEIAGWTTLATQKPTINGRYGNFPPAYPRILRRAQRYPGTIERSEVDRALEQWCRLHNLDPLRIQVIRIGQD
jgi:hypothetical protein